MSSFAKVRARVGSFASTALLRARAVQWRLSGALDEPWYRDLRPDIPREVDAVFHYLLHGATGVRPPDVATARRLRRKEAEGAFNAGWYGEHAIVGADRFRPANALPGDRATFDLRLARLLAGFGPGPATPLQSIAPLKEIRAQMKAGAVRLGEVRAAGITLVTPSIREIAFQHCAASVAEVARAENVEWLIVNDESGLTNEALMRSLPPRAAACARIIDPDPQRAAALPMALIHGRYDWIVPMRADETIACAAVAIVSHYARKFPACACLVGPVAQMNQSGQIVFHNPVVHDGTALFEADPATLMVAIRRDALGEVGRLPALAVGQEGYDCALRIAAREPVLVIPDYLGARPALAPPLAFPDLARRVLLRNLAPDSPMAPRAVPRRGICFTRTQGRRLDLLEQAVRSIAEQSDMQSCVIVHADEAAKSAVAAMCSERNLEALILHAPAKAGSKRGSPLNVGLDYLRARADQYDVFCFLDDDDWFYPMHSARLREALHLSGADIAVGLACADALDREPSIEHVAMPPFGLASGNIFPINAYLARTDLLVSSGARFREDLHYLEDWDFILQLYGAGARIQHVPEALCCYRVIGDGNRVAKEDEAEFQRCWDEVAPRGLTAAQKRGQTELWRDLLAFDFGERAPFPKEALTHMRKSVELVQRATGQ